MALAFIRLQYLANALNDIQHQIAAAISKIGQQDDYHRVAFPHFLAENWKTYFEKVQQLVNENVASFPTGGDYVTSKRYVDALLKQARGLHDTKTRLHHSLGRAFGWTVLSAGLAILAIPAAQWVSLDTLLYVWAFSGVLLVILLLLYYLNYAQIHFASVAAFVAGWRSS